MKILLLAGTREARELSFALDGVDLISSLAGATQRPATLAGRVRIGGFGGAEGLADFLRQEKVTHVIDATHPFARQMSENAHLACQSVGCPKLQIIRPEWPWRSGWTKASDMKAAAACLAPGARVFLATGRGSLSAFAERTDVWFLARVIDETPSDFPLAAGRFLVSRPPFTVKEERKTLTAHDIDTLVVRNSGGTGGFEKIEAAQGLGLQVVMIERPSIPNGPQVETVADALRHVEEKWWSAA